VALVIQPLDRHHKSVVGPVHGWCSVPAASAATHSLRCTTPGAADGSTDHTSGTSPSSSSAATPVIIFCISKYLTSYCYHLDCKLSNCSLINCYHLMIFEDLKILSVALHLCSITWYSEKTINKFWSNYSVGMTFYYHNLYRFMANTKLNLGNCTVI
jgi:hypothetical protein